MYWIRKSTIRTKITKTIHGETLNLYTQSVTTRYTVTTHIREITLKGNNGRLESTEY